MNLPKQIAAQVGDKPYIIDRIGMSGSQVLCYDDMVLKIEEKREESDAELEMMKWLSGRLPVPRILCEETENGVNYLLMSRVKGEMACSPHLLSNPLGLLRILAHGIRMLRSVDLTGCPRVQSIDCKLRQAEKNVRAGLCSTADAELKTYGPNGMRGPEELLAWLKANQPEEQLVFAHGDFCLPNIFVKDDGISGFIDLGRSGAADLYQDIAICLRSMQKNLDGSYDGRVYGNFDLKQLFQELNMKPDWDKVRYYILLDELF